MSNLLLEYRLRKLEKRILNESKQVGTLYHVCTLPAYLKYIVPKDQLKSSGEWQNYLYGNNDYVSFTRNKRYIVSTNETDGSHVLIKLVIDGDKLSEHYRVKPYNYRHWDNTSEDEFGNASVMDYDQELDWTDPKNREQEEVVKGPIKNISKYIKEIQIDVDKLDEDTVKALKSLPRKKSLPGVNIVYTNFVYRKSPTLAKAIRATGLKDGDDLKTAVKLLIEASKNDVEPMLYSRDIGKVKKAIDTGMDLDKEYNRGYPVTFYSSRDAIDILKMLLDAGASPNCPDDPPLNKACGFMGSPEVVKLLLKYGADPNAVDKNGMTPIYAASTNEKNAIELVKILLAAGADIEGAYRKNNYGVTAYSRAYPEVQEFLDSMRNK